MSLQLIRPDITLDFVGKRYFFVALSTLINVAAIGLLFTRWLHDELQTNSLTDDERRCPGEGSFDRAVRRGAGSILDRENRAQICGCRENPRLSGSLRSKKMREPAQYFRVFPRERENRGLGGG
jgi:hypothetical protein